MTKRPRCPKDHEQIDLGNDGEWYLEVPDKEDDGRQQGFVYRPDGRENASIEAALGLGTLTGDDETPIPLDVLQDLKQYQEQYA